ncbi:hypothetical protein ACJ72_05744 [Emergomyces africanus]|uniref:Uncharacterized protein n=1 Tax=Emergomyces africanus TaxID=1955775 RepID=A0A1B7NT12_9EURO|nr:hypothetical protein ACJ72_05744 [Emergomyces africanus]
MARSTIVQEYAPPAVAQTSLSLDRKTAHEIENEASSAPRDTPCHGTQTPTSSRITLARRIR